MAAHPLVTLLETPVKRVLGLMSGTSLDGIDAALCEVAGHGAAASVRLLSFICIPFSAAEREAIAQLFAADTATLCQANFRLGERFAGAAREALGDTRAHLIGSHGQTVWHQPPSSLTSGPGTASTLQLGEPAVIAARTGLVTVADFRVADVAAGGEGAPLVPYADWLLFRQPGRRRALQNIGGMANVALVGESAASVIAFDNGPGNAMIDALAPLATGGTDSIDRDGRYSAAGQVQPDLLHALLQDPYLAQSPPKSTGRERYGSPAALAWAARHADRPPADLLATLVAFSAHAIADSYRRFLLPTGALDEVLVSGGGAHNRTLMAMLAALLDPIPVAPLREKGIDPDAKEAVAFALLAVAALHGEPANLPGVTGARCPTVLGKLCLPPPIS